MYLRLAWYLKALVFCSLIEQIELQYYSLSRALLLGVGGLPILFGFLVVPSHKTIPSIQSPLLTMGEK